MDPVEPREMICCSFFFRAGIGVGLTLPVLEMLRRMQVAVAGLTGTWFWLDILLRGKH